MPYRRQDALGALVSLGGDAAIALAEAAFDLAVSVLGLEAAKSRLASKLDAIDAAEDAREAAFGDETTTTPETPDAKRGSE